MDSQNNSKMEKSKVHRHTPHQIQQLEAFFEEFPNPNDNQKRLLSRKLGLEQSQIHFWFQNRRNQRKIQNDRMDNSALRYENERLHSENQAFLKILMNVKCSSCDNRPPVGEKERILNIQKLRRENAQLEVEYVRIANEITMKTGKPISHLLSLPSESLDHFLSLPAESFLGQQSGNTFIGPIEISEDEKIVMVQKAGHAMNELTKLLLAIEPLWVMSYIYGGYVIDYENYYKSFPKSRKLKCRSSRIESSRELAVVSIAASDLVEMFLDVNKWADLFPTIVMEAKILETLNTGSLGGSLHLIYERTHILSSFVAPRDFVFLRYCQQISPDTWLISDSSYDYFGEIQDMMPRSWMFPSGLMIRSLPDGKTMVTWVDHVEVDWTPTDPLYRDLMSSAHGYGAKRWLSTLERMTERSLYSFSPAITNSPELVEGISTVEGRKNIMALSNRMIRDFCAILSLPERLDLSEFSKYKVKISVHDNNGQGQPHCMIVSASTSIWLPLTFEMVFNFLRDQSRRPEWDLMLNRSAVYEVANMQTGTHSGNGISIIKPCISEEQNKVLLQENSIDPLGALVVFTSVEFETIKAVINGGDSSKIPIIPCGFLISSDKGPNEGGNNGASSSTGVGSSKPFGSLVTLAFQLGVKDSGGSIETQKVAANNLNNLVISIIKNLEVAFGIIELD